jgi:DNA-binding NarL/FixJ family response regulator
VIKVLVADDHEFLRRSVCELLTAAGDICVVAECADGSGVDAAARLSSPDVVLMDLDMPRMGGLEAIRRLAAAQPDVRVVVLTGGASSTAAREAWSLGVAGYMLKDESPAELPDRVRRVAAGERAWSDVLAAELQYV